MSNKSIRSFEEQTIVLSGAVRDGGEDVTIMLSVEGIDTPSLPPLGIETTIADIGASLPNAVDKLRENFMKFDIEEQARKKKKRASRKKKRKATALAAAPDLPKTDKDEDAAAEEIESAAEADVQPDDNDEPDLAIEPEAELHDADDDVETVSENDEKTTNEPVEEDSSQENFLEQLDL